MPKSPVFLPVRNPGQKRPVIKFAAAVNVVATINSNGRTVTQA
jgi:hypothetical protein